MGARPLPHPCTDEEMELERGDVSWPGPCNYLQQSGIVTPAWERQGWSHRTVLEGVTSGFYLHMTFQWG